MIKKLIIIFIIIIIVAVIVSIYFSHEFYHPSAVSASNLTSSSSTSDSTTIIKHKFYSLSYSDEHEQPIFVHYTLYKYQIGGNEPRSNDFKPDSLVSTQTANDSDYVKSGYDRGHLVPAADMSWSKDALTETFLYSNISPQVPSFNRGIWKKLEEKVRKWAIVYDSIEVYAGPVFVKNKGTIGPNQVTIPGYFYKVLLIYCNSDYSGVGFLFPHKKLKDAVYSFEVSIDSIESFSRLNFFEKLPDSIEVKVESTVDRNTWKK